MDGLNDIQIRTNLIKDDYQVLTNDLLGVGINGKVYKCRNIHNGKLCALKILPDVPRSRREVLMHKKGAENCEFIVQIFDIYANLCNGKKSLLIVMECMEGGELFNRISSRETNPYTEGDAKRYLLMIVKAVQHLHSINIAHRDLKPENLLFETKENDSILKLTDFGFAKQGDNQTNPLITPCFTPYYVAPEVLSNTQYDKSCDIWSLGVIAYILLCGYPPFYSSSGNRLSDGMKEKIRAGEYQFNPSDWNDISMDAQTMIQQMLIVDPTKRINIQQIINCSWFHHLDSSRQIDTTSIQNQDNLHLIQNELNSANELQRRMDDEDHSQINLSGPEASRLEKKRAAKKQHRQ